MLRDEVGLKFRYLNSQGKNDLKIAKIHTSFTKGDKYVSVFKEGVKFGWRMHTSQRLAAS